MPSEPRVRADAERNRRRLLDAALIAFSATDGASVALETIARDAGVGIGTLYRHFPSRESLVEAVYRDELARLCEEGPALLAAHGARAGLRAWMGRYAEFVRTKRGMAQALREVLVSGAITSAQTRERLGAVVSMFLDAGAADGTLRADAGAEDVVAGFAGALLAGSDAGQVDRLLDLLLDALTVR